jgi:hypothetical protein
MKKNQLKQIIKEEIKAILSEKNQPMIAPTKPGTKEKEETEVEPKRKRRTLSPPEESPSTPPKALMKEEEKELVDKIAKRFKNLNNG